MRYHTRPWAAWQLSFVALTVGPGSMDSRAKVNRTLGLVVLLVGSILPGRAQLSKNEPASVSQIQDEIKQHPDSPKLYVALGLAFWDRNDFSHALEAFQRAVKLGPSSPEAHNWLGVATMQKGDVLGAIAEFRKAISLNAKYARAYTNLGSAMAKNGDLAGAIGIFQRALALEPNNAAAHVNLGVALREKGDAKAALVHLRLAIKLEPDSVNAQYLLGQTLQQSGDLGGAIETFENLLRIDPEFREGYYALGVALKQQAASQRKPRQPSASQADELCKRGQQVAERGEMKEAQQLLAEALSKDNSHAGAQNLLGFLFGQQGDLTSALIHLERAVALQPDFAEAHYNFGVALWYAGSKVRSVSEVREPARLDPAAGASYAFLGTALRETGEREEARRNLQRAIAVLPSFSATDIDLRIAYLRISPDYADAHANLGAVLTLTDSEQAVRELEKAVALAPGSLKAQFNLAVAYGQNPSYGPAKEIEQLRKVIASQPTFSGARLALGRALLGEGKVEEAIVELREAARLAPQNAQAHYQLGLSLARAGHKDEATAELQKSRELASSDDRNQNAALDIAEGRIALDEGDLDRATAKFKHALELQPESPDAQHFMGTVLEKQGDSEGASAAYRKAVELNPGDILAREKIAAFSGERGAGDDPNRISEFEGYIREGRFQDVEPMLAAYVKEHPKSSWGWYALGYSQFAQQRIGESMQALAKSLQVDIRNAEAHKILGRDLMIIGKFDAAQTEFEQGVRYAPRSSEMHFNLGKLFSIQDEWNAARKEFEEALRINPSYVESWDALGFAQEALGDGAGAVESYEKAIALNRAMKGNFVSAHVNLSAYYNRKGDTEKR